VVDVLGMVAEAAQVLSAQQAPGPEPGLVRDGDHHVPPADARELGERRAGILEVLEHFQAEHEVEGVVGERQLVEALSGDRGVRVAASGELDRLGAEVHCGDAIREHRLEPRESLALATAGVEHGLRPQRLDDRAQTLVEAVDQAADDRIAGLELGVVAALDQGNRAES
jgi:hypothetical protein